MGQRKQLVRPSGRQAGAGYGSWGYRRFAAGKRRSILVTGGIGKACGTVADAVAGGTHVAAPTVAVPISGNSGRNVAGSSVRLG